MAFNDLKTPRWGPDAKPQKFSLKTFELKLLIYGEVKPVEDERKVFIHRSYS